MRELVAKHQEWGVRLAIVKLDIAKRVRYPALDFYRGRVCAEGHAFPIALRLLEATLRMSFHTGDAAISFALTPNPGIPQGSPESPAVYAAVLEGLLKKVETRLAGANLPAGLLLCSEDSVAQVEIYKNSSEAFQVDEIFVVNFADDTYVISREVQEAEHTTAVIR